ncbi:hypothetical protein M0R45_009086 [Rubus argutus]|uniref:Uncharacterized protein n=1 Tax=Rubus argutus TaxID=59490 RepID=A0AAW1Y3H3_RUBAR
MKTRHLAADAATQDIDAVKLTAMDSKPSHTRSRLPLLLPSITLHLRHNLSVPSPPTPRHVAVDSTVAATQSRRRKAATIN